MDFTDYYVKEFKLIHKRVKYEEPCDGRLSSTVPREGRVKFPPLTRLRTCRTIPLSEMVLFTHFMKSTNSLLGFGYGIVAFFMQVIRILVDYCHTCSLILISFHHIRTFEKCLEIRCG